MKRPDLPVLTTLRFPAAFAIFLFHFLSMTSCPKWIWEGLSAGVSFFYVLSGFILYYNYSNLESRGPFWVARFARIWPTHLVTLALALALLPFPSLLGHASWPVTLPTNILLLQAWLPFKGSALSYNGVSWSLSVEAFFYFTFPWLLVGLRKKGALVLLSGSFVVGLILVSVINVVSPDMAAICGPSNPAGRLFEFVLGMCLCQFWLKKKQTSFSPGLWSGYEVLAMLLSLALVVGLPQVVHAVNLDNAVSNWLATALCAIGFAATIWIFAHQGGVVSKLFSTRWLTYLGEISFAVYMCHQILLRWLTRGAAEISNEEIWRIFPTCLILTLVLASMLFYLVETPARHAIVSVYRRRFPLKS